MQQTGSTTCTEDDDFTRVYASPADFFGRRSAAGPAALILREFDIPPTDATHLRVFVRTASARVARGSRASRTTIRSTPLTAIRPVGASARFVRIAEVKAFAGDSTVVSGRRRRR